MNQFLNDFPILKNSTSNGKRLVYLDNGATTQKPNRVIQAVRNYYEHYNANTHRGAYTLSSISTEMFEDTRTRVKDFVNAKEASEIIFTKGTTESFNLLAYSYGLAFINEGDEIVLSISEHHSNILPWQMVAKAKGAVLKYLYLNENGVITQEEIESKITSRTKIVSVVHVSNVLGIVNPIKKITEKAHSVGAVVIMDAAQSIPHRPVDVQELDVDFMAFSAHKMLGPTGIGVLYGRRELLEKMPPFMLGGGMIDSVSEQEAVFTEIPFKFEGGTQNMGGAAGLHEAIDYIEDLGYSKIMEIEEDLTQYALKGLAELPYVTVYGKEEPAHRTGVISFNIDGAHPHDIATILDSDGVAVRSGHHCAHPLMQFMGVNATCRMSLYFYNTREDIDIFLAAVKKVRGRLGLEPR